MTDISEHAVMTRVHQQMARRNMTQDQYLEWANSHLSQLDYVARMDVSILTGGAYSKIAANYDEWDEEDEYGEYNEDQRQEIEQATIRVYASMEKREAEKAALVEENKKLLDALRGFTGENMQWDDYERREFMDYQCRYCDEITERLDGTYEPDTANENHAPDCAWVKAQQLVGDNPAQEE